MLKRSLTVLALLVVGASSGVLATGALRVRDGIALANAAVASPEPRTTVGAPAPVPAQNGPSSGPRIAVVNLRTCFDEANYEYAKEITGELKKLRDELEGNIKRLGKQLEDLKTQMEGLNRNTNLYQAKLREARLIEMQAELDGKLGDAKWRAENSRLTLELYNEIRRVIEIFGRDKKYDFILRVEEPQLDEEMQRVVSQQIAQRVVLFHGDAFDVTKDILKLLNEEYKARKAGKGPVSTGRCPDPACATATQLDKCPRCNKDIPKK